MALAAEMFEDIRGGDAPDPGGRLVRQTHRDPFHQAATVRVADAGWIDHAIGRHGGHVGPALTRHH